MTMIDTATERTEIETRLSAVQQELDKLEGVRGVGKRRSELKAEKEKLFDRLVELL